MEKEILDYVLVPLGLLLMLAYHLWLLRQIIRRPSTTVIGINAFSRRLWVRAMMEDTPKNGILAVQTLRNNIMASTVLASMAIMLSSVIAVLMSSGGCGHPSVAALHVGEISNLGSSIKFFSILLCFLGAFLLNVQSIRYYSHASMLINVPTAAAAAARGKTAAAAEERVTAEYVWRTVNRGSYFWSLGLHAFYISFPLFLWIFGPIPMFLSCILLVFLLYFLDVAADVATVFSSSSARAQEEAGHRHHHYSVAEEAAV